MDLIRYGYNGNLLTILQDRNGNPWWVANEVCEILGLINVSKALIELDICDKRDITGSKVGSNISKLRIINEPGLYSLIFKSRKPEAKTFKRWVTHEVLPSIRKTGAYHHQDPNENQRNADQRKGTRKETAGDYNAILKEQRQLHQLFEHAYKIAKRMTPSGKEASLMAQAKVQELTGIDLAESYHLPPGMKSQNETDKETIAGFVNDCCLVGDEYQISATEFYQAFRNWFEHNHSGEVPTQKWFGTRIGRRFKRKKDSVYKYLGIALRQTIITDEGYVRDFIDDCCDTGRVFSSSLRVLYEGFCEFYLRRTDEVPLASDTFGETLSRQFSIIGNEPTIFSGIKLLTGSPAES